MDRPELIFQDADTEFVKDEFYEDFQAPKFYDFCLPHQSVDADTWFRVSSPPADALNAVPETTEGQERTSEQELGNQEEAPAPAAPAVAGSVTGGTTVSGSTALHRQAEEDLSGLFERLLYCTNNEQPKLNKSSGVQVETLPDGGHSKVPEPEPSAAACPPVSKPERKRMLPRSKGTAAAKAEPAVLNAFNSKQQTSKKRNISQAVHSGNKASDSSHLGKLKTVPKSEQQVGSAADHMNTSGASASSLGLQHGCFVGHHKKLKTTCPRPFRLLTEERGALKELEFNKKMEQYLQETDQFQPASSFAATVNYAAWGAAKALMPVVKDQSKDQKHTSEKGTRLAEPVGGRSQAERNVLDQKQGKERVVQLQNMEGEALKDRKCNRKVETKKARVKTGLHDPSSHQPETEAEAEKVSVKVLEPPQANGNPERGALKEIKYNKKSDNLVACPGGEHLFHDVPLGEAAQVAKKIHVIAQKHGKEDRVIQKPSVALALKHTGDFFFQAQRSLKKLTVPRAPKLHLPRNKRDCSSKQVAVD